VEKVQIPATAVSAAGDDILAPTTELLRGISLLGSDQDNKKADGFGAAFSGPPASVALIEAGATAASKWWAAGLAGGVAVAWGRVVVWWNSQNAHPDTQQAALLAAGIVTAAAALGIAYLMGSDVRGRAAAAVATIEARAKIAEAMVQSAQTSAGTTNAPPTIQLLTLPEVFVVRHTAKASANEAGWRAIAVLTDGNEITKYLVTKGAAHEWVDAAGIDTTPAGRD
jgi:hypothetical protein